MKYNAEDASSTLKPGNYPATIAKMIDTVSKKTGQDMLEIHIEVWNGNQSVTIREYVTAKMIWKLKKLAKAIGQLEAFERSTETVASDYVGYNFVAEVDIEAQEGYEDKNVIVQYLPSEPGRTPPPAPVRSAHRPAAQAVTQVSEADIPF